MAKPAFDASLSPETVARYSAELTDLLERIDTAKEELREESKERRAEIRSMEKGAYRLRKLLRGEGGEQTEIPGAEIPSLRPPRGASSVTFSIPEAGLGRRGDRSVTLKPEHRATVQAAIDAAVKPAKRGRRKATEV